MTRDRQQVQNMQNDQSKGRKPSVMKSMNTRVLARALFFTCRHHYRYRHERDPTGETGLSDLERERSLIIASVHAHCGPRAECLGRRRLLGKATLL